MHNIMHVTVPASHLVACLGLPAQDVYLRLARLMAYINYAPMRIGTEDPWALTELAKAGGPGGRSPPSLGEVGGVTPSR